MSYSAAIEKAADQPVVFYKDTSQGILIFRWKTINFIQNNKQSPNTI